MYQSDEAELEPQIDRIFANVQIESIWTRSRVQQHMELITERDREPLQSTVGLANTAHSYSTRGEHGFVLCMSECAHK